MNASSGNIKVTQWEKGVIMCDFNYEIRKRDKPEEDK